jgi:hypothetical protein
LAGVPETNFRAGPNNVDLKSFGDLLLNLEKLVNNQQLDSGITDVNVTSVTNIASSSSVANCIYTRIGNIVNCSVSLSIQVTSSGFYEIELEVPIPTTFNSSLNAKGVVGIYNSGAGEGGVVTAKSGTSKVKVQGVSGRTSAAGHFMNFQYEIQ